MSKKLEDEINRRLSAATGFSPMTVGALRAEFRKFGRNPLESSLEILAIENGLDEQRVKTLFELHSQQQRRLDGLAEQKMGF